MNKIEKNVVKVGSDGVTVPMDSKDPTSERIIDYNGIRNMAADISNTMSDVRKGIARRIALVSSGAIATGRSVAHGNGNGEGGIVRMQELASIGQPPLTNEWQRMFNHSDNPYTLGLCLLDPHNFYDEPFDFENASAEDRIRYEERTRIRQEHRINAIRTIDALMQDGYIPFVNENDVEVVDEIKRGDNDTLGAYAASEIGAKHLLFLSEVPGIYNKDPRKKEKGTRKYKTFKASRLTDDFIIDSGRFDSKSQSGTGGAISKLQAARYAAEKGVIIVVAQAKLRTVVSEILNGNRDVGTWILPE